MQSLLLRNCTEPSPFFPDEQQILMARCGRVEVCQTRRANTLSRGKPQESQDKRNFSLLRALYVGCLRVRDEGC